MRDRRLWIILIVAAALRLALLAGAWGQRERLFTPDSYDYDELARNMIERGEFTRTGQPEIFRTPGYPAFVAGIYWLSGNSAFAVAGAGIVLDTALCLLAFLLGRELISQRVGLVAAAIQAISPVAIVSSVRLLSGGPFALLITAALLMLVKCIRTSRWRWALGAGAAVGAACLVRPIALPMVLIAIVVLLSRLKRCYLAAAFTAAALVFIMPWMLRNSHRAEFNQLSAVANFNLFYCNALAIVEVHPDTPMTWDQGLLDALPSQYGEDWPPARLLNDPEFVRMCGREGLAMIRQNKLGYAHAHLRTAPNIFLPAATDVLEVLGVTTGGKGTLAVLRTQGLTAAVRRYFGEDTWAIWLCAPMLLILALKHLFALVWLIPAVRTKPRAEHWLLILTFAYFVLIPGPVAHARFRLPVAPLISIAAAAGICWLVGKLRSRRSRRHRERS